MAKFKVGDKIHIPKDSIIPEGSICAGGILCYNCEGLDVFIHEVEDGYYYYTISSDDDWTCDKKGYSCHEKIDNIDFCCELVPSSYKVCEENRDELKLTKEGDEIVVRIPLWQEGKCTYGEGSYKKKNLIGVISDDEITINYLIYLDYKESFQVGNPIIHWIWQPTKQDKKEFEELCKKLELPISWEVPVSWEQGKKEEN